MDDLFGFEELFPLGWSSCVWLCVFSMRVCPISRAGTSLSSWVMAPCPGEGEPCSPPCLPLFSLSFFLQRPHMVFLTSPPLLSHILALLFGPQKCISQQKPEAAEGRNAALLSSQKRPLSVPTGRPAKSHLCLFLRFWGIKVLSRQARHWWTC